MEDSKYYTPEIEEFHVGFEYELLKKKSVYDSEWKFDIVKKVFDVNVVSNSYDWARFSIDLKDKEIRVKYLDLDDIKSLGWKFEHDGIRQASNGTEFSLAFIPDKHMIGIYNTSLGQGAFNGMCKNKSELLKVMNQLGIKNK